MKTAQTRAPNVTSLLTISKMLRFRKKNVIYIHPQKGEKQNERTEKEKHNGICKVF